MRPDVASMGLYLRENQVRRMPAMHVHADIEINFLLTGGMRYQHQGMTVDVPIGRLLAFWAAIPHQVVDRPEGTRFMIGCIPLAIALHWGLPGRLMAQLLAGELVLAPQEDGPADRIRLGCWARDLASGDAELRRIVALELQARMLRLGLGNTAEAPAQNAEGRGAVERMASYIGAHYVEPIGAAEIAAVAGMHQKSACTIFRRACGITPGVYLLRLRLAHAKQLLMAERARTIASIALDSGFGSQSRFYEAFTREFGYSPGEFRRLTTNAGQEIGSAPR